MKNEKNTGIKLEFGFLDKFLSGIKELSELQGTKTFKTSTGKEFVVSTRFDISNIKKQPQNSFKEEKKEIRPKSEEREPLVDVFDEGKNLRIVAELPGTEKKNIKLKLEENKLIISTKDKKYHKEVELPSKAKLSKKFSYKNGVLEIDLEKLR